MTIKQQCENKIKEAIEYAIKNGFKVVVGNDPEGNEWHRLNPQYLQYEDTKEKYIALGVFNRIDENEIFENNE